MEVGETHATCGQAIEDRGLHRTTVTAEIAVPKVVDEQGDDVGAFASSEVKRSQRHDAKTCEDGFHVISVRVYPTVRTKGKSAKLSVQPSRAKILATSATRNHGNDRIVDGHSGFSPCCS